MDVEWDAWSKGSMSLDSATTHEALFMNWRLHSADDSRIPSHPSRSAAS